VRGHWKFGRVVAQSQNILIDSAALHDNAKLIKTRSGIRNELQYDIDFSSSANADNPLRREEAWIRYDAKRKIIAIPVIDENGRLTAKKIRYHFTGKYFEKM
jgi:hypothetical protein